jgi:hypothetical protein
MNSMILLYNIYVNLSHVIVKFMLEYVKILDFILAHPVQYY